MTYDLYRYIFIIAAVLCGVMLVVSVLIFILMNIPKVISDLSGATARKAIKNIRESNERSGDKGHKVSSFNESRGRLTDKISPSGRIVPNNASPVRMGMETAKIQTQELSTQELSNETTVLGAANETTVLGAANETTVLDAANETTVLSQTNETTDLSANNETAILSGNDGMAEAYAPVGTVYVEYEITYIHTNEIISTEAM